MFDRASTFADPEIVEMLQTEFVPVAIDQAYQRRQQDAEGAFYRRIASQGPRNDFANGTSQGFYIAQADGTMLLFNNNRNPERLRRLMREALTRHRAADEIEADPLEDGEPDERFNPSPPEGGLVVRVRAKVMDGYAPSDDGVKTMFQNALSRDNLWVSGDEHEALVRGEVPQSLVMRLARFHLVDNTRGEPPMWREGEVLEAELMLSEGVLRGSVELETADGERGYAAELLGRVTVDDGAVVGLELVALGTFHGEGRYTRGAPEGDFTLAVAFTLADGGDVADAIPPQGSRGWVRGYMELR
ncbi:hypothetical protein OT109_14100 [Phycisphaeraceae bacterium D3-23]